jgi:hypothetical protein
VRVEIALVLLVVIAFHLIEDEVENDDEDDSNQ